MRKKQKPAGKRKKIDLREIPNLRVVITQSELKAAGEKLSQKRKKSESTKKPSQKKLGIPLMVQLLLPRDKVQNLRVSLESYTQNYNPESTYVSISGVTLQKETNNLTVWKKP